MGRDTGIADRLREAGLKVVEVAGWKTRGSSTFSPRGSVDHHTAGASSGNAPSLAVVTYGRSDLPGPLCHVLVGRDNTCYVVAAGRANHAGRGGWSGLSGNSSVWGVERENVGTSKEPWRPDQTETAARVHAALIGPGGNPMLVCEHKEWAPNRKIDAHTIAGSTMRDLVKQFQHQTVQGDEIDMATMDDLRRAVRDVLNEGTAQGQSSWAGTNRAILGTGQDNSNRLRSLASQVSEVHTEVESVHKDVDAVLGGRQLAWIAATPESRERGTCYLVDGFGQTKVEMRIGGPLHESVKSLQAVAGLSVNARDTTEAALPPTVSSD